MIGFRPPRMTSYQLRFAEKRTHTILKIHSSSEFPAALGGPTSWASERHSEGKRWKGETRAPTPWFRSGAPYCIAVHGPFANGFWGLGVPLMHPHVQVGTSLVGTTCLGLRRKNDNWQTAGRHLWKMLWPPNADPHTLLARDIPLRLGMLNLIAWTPCIETAPRVVGTRQYLDAQHMTTLWCGTWCTQALHWKPTWTFAGITRLLWSKFVLDTNDCFWPDPTPSKHETATICNLHRIQQLSTKPIWDGISMD